MKTRIIRRTMSILLAVFMAFPLCIGCAAPDEPIAAAQTQAPTQSPVPQSTPREDANKVAFVRSLDQVSFENLPFTPWDVSAAQAAAGQNETKKYTIMVYLNGADLESDAGMATADLQEMIDAQFDNESINLLILTGGTRQWQNELVPNETCALYQVIGGELELIQDIGQRSIGDAGTLSSYIDFSMTTFPAEKYGLILWNHGGGAIAGYGVDENFDFDALTLLEINLALEKSKAKETKLEFLGFDACLMATIETATVAQQYSKYLIGSEELEPGNGWDYHWLSALSEKPEMSGAEIGTVIVDLFTAFYEGSGEDTTLSVIDLSKIDAVWAAMGRLMAPCTANFTSSTFSKLSKSRNKTKTFGGGSPRENETDMIDIADMASELMDLYPEEAQTLIAAVDDAVICHKNSEDVEGANGLTTYYTFGGKEQAAESLEVYRSLVLNADYTAYLDKFASVLTGEVLAKIDVANKQPQQDSEGDYSIKLSDEEMENLLEIYFTVWEPVEGEPDYYFMLGENSSVEIAQDGTITTGFDGEWPGINGEFVCLYEISNAQSSKKFAIPAQLNGEDVDLIAVFDAKNPDGKILGARPVADEDTDMAAKSLIKIKAGDKLKFLYYAEYFGEDSAKNAEEWYEGDEFTVEELKIEMLSVNAGETYLYGFLLKDIQENEYYTDFVEVEFTE